MDTNYYNNIEVNTPNIKLVDKVKQPTPLCMFPKENVKFKSLYENNKNNAYFKTFIHLTGYPYYIHYEDIKNEKHGVPLKKKWKKIKELIKKIPEISNELTWDNPGILKNEIWNFIQFSREEDAIELPINNIDKAYSTRKYCYVPNYTPLLLFSFMKYDNLCHYKKTHIKEAIASAIVEGAKIKKDLTDEEFLKIVKENNIKDLSLQMAVNNYVSYINLVKNFETEDLSIELIKKLHKEIAQKTDIPKEKQGVFRKNSDAIRLSTQVENEVTHIPPPMEFVEEELKTLCNFMNEEKHKNNIDVLTKAIILHFSIGYLHPFFDGNGRVARNLFYWYLNKHDMPIFNFIPISQYIKKSNSGYEKGYIRSERTMLDNKKDLTYFLNYNYRIIEEGIINFLQTMTKNKTKDIEIENKNATNRKNLKAVREDLKKQIESLSKTGLIL